MTSPLLLNERNARTKLDSQPGNGGVEISLRIVLVPVQLQINLGFYLSVGNTWSMTGAHFLLIPMRGGWCSSHVTVIFPLTSQWFRTMGNMDQSSIYTANPSASDIRCGLWQPILDMLSKVKHTKEHLPYTVFLNSEWAALLSWTWYLKCEFDCLGQFATSQGTGSLSTPRRGGQ